jgi:cyclopropane fatty-acyl-phospholipid synthase-like methyltransferase
VTPLSENNRRAIAKKIASRYPTPFLRHYTYWKTVTDPVYPAACEILRKTPSLPLLDLGCGAGQFAFFLRECGYDAPLLGVELDAEKAHIANRIAEAHDLSARFLALDYREMCEPHRGHVCLLDVLQYIPLNEQREMLARAAGFVNESGGVFIARNGLKDDSKRYAISRLVDRFARAIRWISAPPVDYPTRELFEEVLGSAGLKVEVRPLWGGTPFNNHLIIARK